MNWYTFSKNRKYLMGFAIVLIIIFHWCEDLKLKEVLEYSTTLGYIAVYAVNKIVFVGSAGVDTFLFLSGIGLYFSYTKKPDLKAFYAKRLIAIVIPYLIIAVPYLLWQNFIYTQRGFLWFLADLSLITTFTKFNGQGWYIALILVLYLLFPLFYKLMKKHSAVMFILLEFVFCLLPLAVQYYYKDLFSAIQIALTRIPTFILGVYCGRFVYEKKNMRFFPFLLISALAGVIAVKYVMINIHYNPPTIKRYECALIMLILLVGLSTLLDKFSLTKTKTFFAFFAPITLELYLTHVEVRRMFSRLFTNCWTLSNANLAFVSIIAISVPVAWYVNKLSGKISAKIKPNIKCLN